MFLTRTARADGTRTGSPVRESIIVILAAVIAAIGTWAVIRLAGIDLVVEMDGDESAIGIPEVVFTTIGGGIAAWGVHEVLRRTGKARWWPFAGGAALALSTIGPSRFADGESAVALICLHVVVAVVLIVGFARTEPNPCDAVLDQVGDR